jgi:hypothetical protein
MAGAYQEIALGRDYTFTSNVAARVAALGVSIVNATFQFTAKAYPDYDGDGQAVLNTVPTANANVITVTIPASDTAGGLTHPLLLWEITALTAANGFYTLDAGRMAIVQPVRISP